MKADRAFYGGAFAMLAVRGAVQSAHHLASFDDFLLAVTSVIFGGIAAVLLTERKKP